MSVRGNWDRRGGDPIGRLGSIDRRRFLRLSGAGAAALVAGAGPYTERALAASALTSYPFRLGVASGDPRPTEVVLWTRLAPRPHDEDGRGGMPARKVDVRWEVAHDEAFRQVVARGRAPAYPELGHSVHVEVGGLRPARRYFYRFKAGADTSPVGRTSTVPQLGRAVRELTFAFASCQQFEHGYYTAYRHMAREDLDLVVHLGDYIYEYGPNRYNAPGGNVRRHNSREPTKLAGYRRRHALYRDDSNLKAAHAAFPWVVTWDDHEVENNYADDIAQHGGSREYFLRRRAAAYQAYYEHMPLRRFSAPAGPDMRLFRTIAYGDLAHFRVLDTRQYRDDQASGDGQKPSSAQSRASRRTMTGASQERWLLGALGGSSARWNVLAQQAFFAELDLGSGSSRQFNMDAWDGYWAARRRILDYIATRRVRNPVVLTGDVHANWANDVLRNFDDPDSRVVAAEFVGTSISSGGDGSDQRSETQRIRARNPHVRFFNGQRGYVRCHVTPERWRTDYRVVPYVSRRGAPVSTRATFVVEAGRPGLQRAGGGRAPSAAATSSEVEGDRARAQRRADE
ncbi:MAG: alkaline phosphatase D family protein [Actinomycetota bacterium]|nr:alkaline phosphatase D family protein [Actinomycetota bacterium]